MVAWPWSVRSVSCAIVFKPSEIATEHARLPVSIARIRLLGLVANPCAWPGLATAAGSVLLVMAVEAGREENRQHHDNGRDHGGGFRRGNRPRLRHPRQHHQEADLPAGR